MAESHADHARRNDGGTLDRSDIPAKRNRGRERKPKRKMEEAQIYIVSWKENHWTRESVNDVT